ncbi:DUF6660 family protein [Zunongwangia sp. SCSIO 43204]|uniref:DUF6660 family protein n=1 Tax=Zunongwangia sp. SCSIO 43204 TaxID=2779359 RepID=UPI00351CFDD5|tara:strand:+ start:747 stop:1055 length:309 start_codon:yes stop_codon:yes gene_type:complete
MRFLAVIFSVYLLSLSFMPCEDNVTFQKETTEFHQVDGTHASGTAADDCSPFCQCHCCHLHIVVFDTNEIDLISLDISTMISTFRYEMGDDIPQFLFQPPRV